uniref:B30.2/SPRY domain-containing protein n=1 Tax=Hucho hucho TaxID=62062 RepID=A0A4W5KF36_9TELE
TLFLSLSLALSLPVCVYFSVSLSVSLSLSLSLSLSVSLSVPLSLCRSLCPSLSLSLSLSLQSYQSLSSISVSSDLPSIVVRPLQYFGDVSKTVSELREKLEDFLKGEWTKISTTDSCQLTLDPNTADTHLSLSKGNRKVTYTRQVQPYPGHPDRFTNWCQVLCREGLSGCCYWEVEWSGYVDTAVSYKDISRTERGGGFGLNNKSWTIQCYNGGYWFRHNNVVTKVSGPQSSRVGVYLDHKAGTLSFYSVSDTMTLLHRVQTTFTQPLYPGFWLNFFNGTAELVKL